MSKPWFDEERQCWYKIAEGDILGRLTLTECDDATGLSGYRMTRVPGIDEADEIDACQIREQILARRLLSLEEANNFNEY